MIPHLRALITLIAVISVPARANAETFDEWIPAQREASVRKLLAAIGRNGAVIASPDESTPGQDYYFHWVRDGALVMNVVVDLYAHPADAEDKAEYAALLRRYCAFSRKNQTASQPMGFMGLGEPKFLVTGSVFPDPNWPKPQNDGPALRTITLCHWSTILRAEGQVAMISSTIEPIVRDDIGFTLAHWQDKCKDLWEETRGKHFYTRMVQRRALVEGEKFFQAQGDMALANSCHSAVVAMDTTIDAHFDATAGYIRATLEIENGPAGKDSQLDAAAILAVLHADSQEDSSFSPTDDRVLLTAFKLRQRFNDIYPINQNLTTDPDGEHLEPAIGRYPEDFYDGANNQQGNPWFLTTAAMAELHHRASTRFSTLATIAITDRNLPLLQLALDAGGGGTMSVGDMVPTSDARHGRIVQGLRMLGDGYLRRIRLHGALDGSLSEQFRRSNGFMTGAADLSWSYAAVITALAAH